MSRAPLPCPICGRTDRTTYIPGRLQVDGRDTARCFKSHDGEGPCDFFVDDGTVAKRGAAGVLALALARCKTTEPARGFSGAFLAHCGMRTLTREALECLAPDDARGILKSHIHAARELWKQAEASRVPVVVAPLYDGFEMVGLELRAPDLEHGPRPGDARPEGTGKTSRVIGKRACYVPDVTAAPSVAVVIFEGVWNVPAAAHDALEAQNEDFAFIATGGASLDPRITLRTLDAFFHGLPAVLVPDRDTPGMLQHARNHCSRGHCVRPSKLPVPGKDYRDAPRGTRWDALLEAVERALDAADDHAEARAQGPYKAECGRLWWTRDTREGPKTSALCEFEARITTETIQDDGEGQDLFFTIAGTLPSGRDLPPVQVPAAEFPGMSWPLKHWGTAALIHAGQTIKDHLRAAILTLSTPEQRQVFMHTGWRQLDGEWCYIHAGGAIGPEGPKPEVLMDPGQSRIGMYTLPAPAEGGELRRALASSVRILDLGPEDATAPVWLATFRATLGTAPFSVHIEARPEAGKSELAAIAAGHFGPMIHGKGLLESWDTTPGAIGRALFLAKDTLAVVDDFRPGDTRKAQDEARGKADAVFRSAFNQAARGRLHSDARALKRANVPRGLTLSTGEALPDGHSLRSRVLMLEWPCDAMRWEVLTELQVDRAAGLHAALMASFIKWQARDRPRVLEMRRMAQADAVDALRKLGGNRTGDLVADLWSAWPVLETFILEAEAMDSVAIQALRSRLWEAMARSAGAQVEHVQDADPVDRFLEGLRSVLESGRGHLLQASWDPALSTELQGLCGWRDGIPQGACLGYAGVSGGVDEVWLFGEAAFFEVDRLISVGLPSRTLWKRLNDRKLLRLEKSGRLASRRTLPGGARPTFYVMARSSLWPSVGDTVSID